MSTREKQSIEKDKNSMFISITLLTDMQIPTDHSGSKKNRWIDSFEDDDSDNVRGVGRPCCSFGGGGLIAGPTFSSIVTFSSTGHMQ